MKQVDKDTSLFFSLWAKNGEIELNALVFLHYFPTVLDNIQPVQDYHNTYTRAHVSRASTALCPFHPSNC